MGGWGGHPKTTAKGDFCVAVEGGEDAVTENPQENNCGARFRHIATPSEFQKTTQKNPEEISDDAILIQAIKRGLIDPNAIVQSQVKPKEPAKGDKVILMRRKAKD